MSEKPNTPRKKRPSKVLTASGIVILLIAAAVGLWYQRQPPSARLPESPPAVTPPPPPRMTVEKAPVVHADTARNTPAVQAEQERRKEKYGLDKGVDVIVTPEESVQVGEKTVSVRRLADAIRVLEGDVVERDIGGEHRPTDAPESEYGIYVVTPGDNVWNLHFRFLREYFMRRGIDLSSRADEPDNAGMSSGVGKLLKFSEGKVYIYNLNNRAFESDINVIHPDDKIVIYNMRRIFDLLDRIDSDSVSRIQFDGKMLWIPAES